jgi:hypothetical protein
MAERCFQLDAIGFSPLEIAYAPGAHGSEDQHQDVRSSNGNICVGAVRIGTSWPHSRSPQKRRTTYGERRKTSRKKSRDLFAQDLSRTPPTKEQRENDYKTEKKKTGDAARGQGVSSIEHKTEDEIARGHLGGVKGSKELEPAPLTENEAEQLLPNDDDGHPA